jgi:elongation factor 2
MINKIDRGILELQVDGETMYQQYLRVIENVNVVIATYEQEGGDKLQVDPACGTVAFGSALFGWAFTTTAFAKTYSKKFGIERTKMMEKLWGDNYFDTKAKKWKNHDEADDKSKLKRCFVQFIMAPVIGLCKATMNGEMEKVEKMIKNLDNVKMKADDLKLQGKHLMKNVF